MENGIEKNEFTDSEESPSDTDFKESKLKQDIIKIPKKVENNQFQKKKTRPLDENEKIQDYGKPKINKYTFKRSDFSYKTHINKSNLSQSQRPTQYNQFNQFTQIIRKKTLSDKNESEPKDNLSKRSINKKLYSSVNQNIFFTRQKYLKDSYNYKNDDVEDIPRTMFFQKYDKNTQKKEAKNVINVEKKNNSELVEIPREKYSDYRGKKAVYMTGGIDTGEYKFNGAKIVLKEKEIPVEKIEIKEEEINKEIINRRNKIKKDPKLKYEILDKFYATTEFPGKHKVEVKKVKVQKKRYIQEYKEQKNYQKNNISYENLNKFDFKKYKNKKDNLNQIENLKKYFNSFHTYKNDENQYQNEDNNNYKNEILNNDKNINLPNDNYSRYMLDEINKVRTDPQSFIGIIEDAKDNIMQKNGRIFYNGKLKIALTKGESAFNDAINYLKKAKPMGKLQYSKLMTVKPPFNEKNIRDKKYMGNKIKNMLKNGINIKSYWRDIINDPEISFLLMIVDDNGPKSGMRRNDILDPNMKYIGISSTQINHSFSCYIALGSEL